MARLAYSAARCDTLEVGGEVEVFELLAWVLVAHIAVLGYWLGAELVINSTYRHVAYADGMAFEDRSRLMDHVLHVDQHVRYALVLQMALGIMLAAGYGFVPGGDATVLLAAAIGALWLIFIEAVHRLRKQPAGNVLAAVDRGSRFGLIAILLAVAVGWLGSDWGLPTWLKWKLAAFAGVIGCGVGIRFVLLGHFRTWNEMTTSGVTADGNAAVKRIYARATSVLVLLWLFIAAITGLSVTKPV